jgi:hypothetical protein
VEREVEASLAEVVPPGSGPHEAIK